MRLFRIAIAHKPTLLLVVAAALFAVQIHFQFQQPTFTRLMPSQVEYSELIPDKDEYRAGDLMRFTYNRTVSAKMSDQAPILLLTVDSFRNLDTGEVFEGLFANRVVRNGGEIKRSGARRISQDATPGTYVLEGWASVQSNPLSAPSVYNSKAFRIVSLTNEETKSTSP